MSNRFFEIASPALRCALCADGASVARVQVRRPGGAFMDVALAPRSLRDGGVDPSLAGRTIGPCCGRVRGGEARIEGRPVRLTQNEGRNHLHGGDGGCARRRWTVREHTPSSIWFCASLPDGLDGYPGNRALSVRYTVAGGALRAEYRATSDAPTWLDLTNHVYWDLSGRFDGAAMDQVLEIAAGKVVLNDEAHLPQAIADADGALDFSAPCALSEKLARYGDHPQLQIARGFNNAYLIDPALCRSKGFAARLTSPDSGLSMALRTDQPALVLYSGGFLDAGTPLLTPPGVASPGCAVALEAQGLPDPFHLPGAAPDCLRPGEVCRRAIEWRFEG